MAGPHRSKVIGQSPECALFFEIPRTTDLHLVSLASCDRSLLCYSSRSHSPLTIKEYVIYSTYNCWIPDQRFHKVETECSARR